jgi:hypothetical protein
MQDQIATERVHGASFKLVRPNREKICGWIDQAWNKISSQTIANGFRASGLMPSEECLTAASFVTGLHAAYRGTPPSYPEYSRSVLWSR